MKNKVPESATDAEVIALNLLGFLASDQDRLERFVAITGILPASLADAADDPSFLAGVMDYALADEALLIEFASRQGIKPEVLLSVRRKLPGASL